MKFNYIFLILIALSTSGCAVATVSAVYYLKSTSHEVATVNIKALPENVYSTVIEKATANKEVQITSRDDDLMQLELMKNNNPISVKVLRVNNGTAQLLISASNTETDKKGVLDNVLLICKDMNIVCSN